MREIEREREHVQKGRRVRTSDSRYFIPSKPLMKKRPSGPIIINTHLQKRRLTLREDLHALYEHLILLNIQLLPHVSYNSQ
jgi:hypothetical protein